MSKHRNILIVSAALVIIGIGISFYQSQNEMDSLTTQQQSLASGATMIVSKNLDPIKGKNGAYSVQISDFKVGYNVKVNLTDPSGNTIITRTIAKDTFQENFTISQLGNYTLQIQNPGENETQVTGIIGYYPQGASIIDVASVMILVVGLSGLAIGMIYMIKSRSKFSTS